MQSVKYDRRIPSTSVEARNFQELKTACKFISYETSTTAILKLIEDNPNIIQANPTQPISMRDLVANYVALTISTANLEKNPKRITQKDKQLFIDLGIFHETFVMDKSEIVKYSSELKAKTSASTQLDLQMVIEKMISLNAVADVLFCLESGVDIDEPLPQFEVWKRNALMLAITQGNWNITSLLIAAGADLSYNDALNFTPISIAANLGYAEQLQAIICA